MQLESRTIAPQSLLSGETLETVAPGSSLAWAGPTSNPPGCPCCPGRSISLSAAGGVRPGSTVCPIRGEKLGHG